MLVYHTAVNYLKILPLSFILCLFPHELAAIHAIFQNCQPQSQAGIYVSVPNIQQMIMPQFPTKETNDVTVLNILNNVKVSVPNIYANKQDMGRFSLRNCRKGLTVVQLYYAETCETPRPDNKSSISFK